MPKCEVVFERFLVSAFTLGLKTLTLRFVVAYNGKAITAPEGLYQPIRGFGKVWRNQVQVRERLGWALELERGFEGVYQIAWEPAYESDGAYLRTADGRVVALTVLGIWDFVTP